ncbi:hypothetical protein [Acidianus bottle-shaped virus 2 strain ABV2]|uniref:Uncharacterized protein n=1 Tax=Acidianus bottle-shaped virus 2 strain ABV2 TaxID=1732173 RepID=A0A0N9PAV8_9VIRU|nr:hypothetical protein AVU01_gp03 [Acidianus bottle-shaped virus 2 strain ABV2]ALG96751.1 hypothetical protein [Acidianus bottle-shaped virus 2 strain ABV2]
MESIINEIRSEFMKLNRFLNQTNSISLQDLRKELDMLHNLLYNLSDLENDLEKKHEVIYSLMYVDSVNDNLDYAVPKTIISFAREQIGKAIQHFNNYVN